MNITSDLEKERITHSHLKEEMQKTEPDEEGFHEIRLRTMGRPTMMTVKADRIKRRRRQIYQDTVRKAIVNCGMSGRQGVKFLRHIRNDLGRKFIVVLYISILYQRYPSNSF